MTLEKTNAASERPEKLEQKLHPRDTDNTGLDPFLLQSDGRLTLPMAQPPLPEIHFQINTEPKDRSPGVLSQATVYSDFFMLAAAGYLYKTNPIGAAGCALAGASMLVRDAFGSDNSYISTHTAISYGMGIGLIGSQLIPRVTRLPL